MSGTKWDGETTLKFVREYKSHECLWNYRSNVYKNKSMREAAIAQIIQVMNIPGFGVPELKTKIKNLRSTYSQEKKKIERSRRANSGTDVYEPNMKWYRELDSIYMENVYRKRNNVPDPTEEFTKEDLKYGLLENISDPEGSTQMPMQEKRRRLQIRNESGNSIQEQCTQEFVNVSLEENRFDVFGKSVASQLKMLSQERALLAQSRIQHVLTELGIEDLRDTSTLQNG